MPVVIKCPNCNAPLDKAPTGPENKCPYCNATLMPTTYMPSPVGAPGPVMGGPYPPAPDAGFPPAPGSDWGTPALGAPGGYTPPVPQIRIVTSHKRSSAGTWISLVTTLLIMGGVGVTVYFAQQQAEEQTQKAAQAVQKAVEDQNAPAELSPGPLVIGEVLEVELPSSLHGPGGDVISTISMPVSEANTYEISLRTSAPYVQCRIKVQDAAGKVLVRTVESDTRAQLYPALDAGQATVVVECDSHPTRRTIFVRARAVPILLAGEQTALAIEPETDSVAAIVVPTEAGRYAIALQCEDTSVSLQVLGENDVLIGKAEVDYPRKPAVLEADLEVTGYLVQALYSSSSSMKIPVTFALTSLAPEAMPMDTDVKGVMTRWVERLYYTFNLGAEGRIAVSLSAATFDHSVEIQRADGVPVATSDVASAREKAKVAPNLPLAAGEYRIIVHGETSEASEGEFTLRVDAVPPEPPPRRGRGGR